ncbi:uncharacterized protein LOC123554200 isoform X2 [Mercenaria mercenaria]|nr:uncharacterized protein LOC123554200 isoform X2 [Mercenaria mercenaria]XP_045200110.2 uncharacterized protein LOC123554200 isoform X2 [Mercenaria mercenaria]
MEQMMKPVLILLFVCLSRTNGEDSETVLKVVPPNTAVQPGEKITLKCQHYPKDLNEDLKLEWFMPDGTIPISQLTANQSVINSTNSNILRYKSDNGTLTIDNVTLDDSGTYKCKKDDYETEVIVKVYNMPSYTTEIIVVLVINAVLVAIFILCAIWNFVRDQKERKQATRKRKLGHKEMITTSVKG